ncbi:MAG: adenosine deaminase [Deltaproteobacteria bacterium RIFCSPHIGHO2_02_FULL_40_11]|nr:MAG: adenosine deaminase [Deltaproteobacteria bacterium RIFCSPHIGHO2_02_FULL_40_11]
MKNILKSLPKIELHRHLEGSIPIDLVLKWSQKYNLPLPMKDPRFRGDDKELRRDDIQAKTPMPFSTVLERLFYQQRCFQNLESVETLTYEVLKSIAQDNIKLLELRFSPGFMAEPQNLSFDGIMEAVLSAKEKAQKDFEIEVGYLLISSRDFGIATCQETIDLALKWKDHIVGIDLAGDETKFPDTLFEKPFQKAKAAGLNITVHTAEVTPAKNILTAHQKLGAQRIGHGVQAATDETVIKYLIENKIPLELCPTSNFITEAVSSLNAHPLKNLLKRGVKVTINSDDPTLFGTTLTHEYEICVEKLGMSLAQIKQTILNSFEASFLSRAQKKRMWEKYFQTF